MSGERHQPTVEMLRKAAQKQSWWMKIQQLPMWMEVTMSRPASTAVVLCFCMREKKKR